MAPFAMIGALIVSASLAPSVRITSSAPLAFGWMPVPPLMVAPPGKLPVFKMPFICTVAPAARAKLLFPLMFSVVKVVASACAEMGPVICKCAVLPTLTAAVVESAPVSGAPV